MRLHFATMTAIALALSAPAHATGSTCIGSGSCPTTTNNTTNAPVANGGAGGQGGQGGAGGAGGLGGSASAVAVAASSSASASSVKSENKNTNDNRSAANSNQGQLQGQLQGQEQGQTVTWVNPRAPVSTAAAAALATSSEACMGSSSIGGQGVGFGLSFGTTWENEDCKLRKQAGLLYAVGAPEAAKELLCTAPEIRAAYLAAGKPCAADVPTPQQVVGENQIQMSPLVPN